MKNLLLSSTLLFFLLNSATCQDFENLFEQLNSFNEFEQYNKVDLEILEASNYLLSIPIQRSNYSKEFYFALKSLVKWCNHTNGYKILIFGKVIESCGDDALMKNMYMAAMAKYLINEKYNNKRHVFPEKQPDMNFGDLPEVKETLLEGAKIFFEYLANTANERPNKELRNGIKANEEGTLTAYMFE